MSEPTADPSSPTSSGPHHASALRGPARPAVELKGLSHPALRLVIGEPDDGAISAALDALLGPDDDAFEWQAVVIDAARVAEADMLDLAGIVDRLREVRLHPVAVAGAHPALREQAERLRLGWLAPLPERRARGGAADAPASAAEPAAAPRDTRSGGGEPAADTRAAEAQAPTQAPQQAAEPAAATSTSAAEPAAGAMVVQRPVRSGQQIYARDRDLIVIGDVSPGAEVIADGHVHVYGTLAGRAIAGARGKRDAVIFTLELRAELVAVCGIYRTFEDGPPAAHAGKPVRIALEADADTLSMRPL